MDIMKIVKSLGIAGLLIKSVCETIQNEAKKQEVGFQKGLMRAGERIIRAGQNF